MPYSKQTWVDGDTTKPLSAARLNYLEQGVADAMRWAELGAIYLDSFGGSDDDKLTSAIAAQQAHPNMPPIVLGNRRHDFNVTRPMYSGLKLVGPRPAGPKNTEQSAKFVTCWVKFGSAIGNGLSSWWVGSGNLFDIFMADFAVEGNGSNQQFLDHNTGTMYACEFRSLGANYLYGMFGSYNRLCAITQVVFSGHWTVNNIVGENFWLGGSDNSLWMNGYINMGPGGATSLYADPATRTRYQMVWSGLSNTNVGYVYISALNGYRGLRIMGNSGNGIKVFGGVYEGFKPTGTINSGPAPGTLIRIEGGSGTFYGPNIGQGMAQPVAGEGGLVHITGGEWSFRDPQFYRGSMAETVPCIFHGGGRLLVDGAKRRQSETWSARPRYTTSASGPNATQTSFYCPDLSMISV